MLNDHSVLFQQMNIGNVVLKNRIALAPTYVGMADERGKVTDQTLCYYFARSYGGCGLVIVEGTGVTGRYAFDPNFGLTAASDAYLPGLSDLARVIHWGGAKAFIQLMPGQGAQALRGDEKRRLVAPSDIPAVLQKEGLPKRLRQLNQADPETPRALSLEEIAYLKRSMIEGAARAKRVGFDGVEVHGAHGYLLAEFTSPYFNRRNDQYGGSEERRWRLSIEIIEEIKRALGKDFPVGYRVSVREFIPGGLEIDESIRMSRAIEEAGADYISITHGCYGSFGHTIPKGEGCMTEDARSIKKAVSIPVLCPNFQDPSMAANAVESGATDIVALSRALLVDPKWANKVKAGMLEEIRKCIRCYHCIERFRKDHLPVRCLVNPSLGFERFQIDYHPRPVTGSDD